MPSTRNSPRNARRKAQRGRFPEPTEIRARLGDRSAVLIGMMGAGKSSVGRRLAARLGLPFIDADTEIEAAAGCSISEIFEQHGEAYFRDGERKVIARLLEDGPQVLATGGGAWMNDATRENIAAHGVSVWLNADLDVLLRRVKRRGNRPLLKVEDIDSTLRRLVGERYPVYALADATVHSRDVPHDVVVNEILAALDQCLPPAADESANDETAIDETASGETTGDETRMTS
ncbi:shikimate kinase [Microbaculum sp. FT89]|uniref:shikimate kinase n=1 Tax=Microbaculum sp. FT89 TaxID=3447298 RepID=UPI003F5351FE